MKTGKEIVNGLVDINKASEEAQNIMAEYIDEALKLIPDLEKPVTLYSMLKAKVVCLDVQLNDVYLRKMYVALGSGELTIDLTALTLSHLYEALKSLTDQGPEKLNDIMNINLSSALQDMKLEEDFIINCINGKVTLREFLEQIPDKTFFDK